jgi:hypothetical protein
MALDLRSIAYGDFQLKKREKMSQQSPKFPKKSLKFRVKYKIIFAIN